MRSTTNWGEPDSIQLPTISVLCCSQSTSSPHTRFYWAGASSVIVWSMANRKYKFVQFIAKITTTKHSTGDTVDNTAQPQTQSIAATRHYQSWCSASWWWWWWTTYTRQHGLNPVLLIYVFTKLCTRKSRRVQGQRPFPQASQWHVMLSYPPSGICSAFGGIAWPEMRRWQVDN